MYNNVMVGADPEVILIDKNSNAVSAIDLMEGTKEKPYPINDKGACIQVDNVLAEFNIVPAKTKEEFIHNMFECIDYLKTHFKKRNIGLYFVSSIAYTPEQLADPRAKVSGCDPDYNVWSLTENDPIDLASTPFRYAGGHVHVSWDNPDFLSCVEFIKAMDVFVGAPMSALFKYNERRITYGKAGNFRFKPYGIEYRTPSNHWASEGRWMGFMFDQIMRTVEFLNNGGAVEDSDYEYIAASIEENNHQAYQALSHKYPQARLQDYV